MPSPCNPFCLSKPLILFQNCAMNVLLLLNSKHQQQKNAKTKKQIKTCSNWSFLEQTGFAWTDLNKTEENFGGKWRSLKESMKGKLGQVKNLETILQGLGLAQAAVTDCWPWKQEKTPENKLFFITKKNKKNCIYLLVMPKYWGNKFLASGVSPI